MALIQFIGRVHSTLKRIEDCPLQESEGAPEVLVTIDEKFRPAVDGLRAGHRVILLTWLHEADRDTLTTRPRNDPRAPITGVFATRSPDRPNPIGLHEAVVLEVAPGKIRVSNMEVIDGTPLIDIKPVL